MTRVRWAWGGRTQRHNGYGHRPTAASFPQRLHRLSVTGIHCKQRISHNRCYKSCPLAVNACFTIQAVVGKVRAPSVLRRLLPALCAASWPHNQNTGRQDSEGRAFGPSPRLGSRCDLLRHFGPQHFCSHHDDVAVERLLLSTGKMPASSSVKYSRASTPCTRTRLSGPRDHQIISSKKSY